MRRLMRMRRLPREEEASLVEHLDELRQRIIVSVAAVALTTAAAFAVHGRILDFLTQALPADHHRLATFGRTPTAAAIERLL